MNVIHDTPRHIPVHPVLWLMVAVMVGLELVTSGTLDGFVPESMGPIALFRMFAFWDVLFDMAVSGTAVYPQVWWMVLTYAFLHGGWLHLAFNGAAFLGLGHALVQSVGIGRFLLIFVVCALGGSIAFGLIAEAQGPMVGASGAIFGFLGVISAWQERELRWRGLSRAPIWRRIAGLVVLNLVLALGLGGLLAWEAHLGGWVAGWLIAGVVRPRGRVPGF